MSELTLLAGPARADAPFPTQIPSRLIECENNRTCDGIWTFGDDGGKAQWANGERADLSVERFDRERIIIHRDDTSNPDFSALYIGTLSGSKIAGTVTYSWPGHSIDNVTAGWSATIDRSNHASLPATPRDAAAMPAPPRAVARSQIRVVEPSPVHSVATATPHPVEPVRAHVVAVSHPKAAAEQRPRTVAANTSTAQSGAALEAHFRHVWSSDQCVQRIGQTFEDYAGWIFRFYGGADGWNANSGTITAKISDSAVRAKRVAELNALGVRVAGEWAKDNSCRKIRTAAGFFNSDEAGKPALTDFRGQLEAGAAADTGDGVRIGRAIEQVAREVDAVLGQQ